MLFKTIRLLIDPEPHGAALNMALDEAVLSAANFPTLRVYQWAQPAVSFGYFENWEAVTAANPGREAVRRWTGGGVVPHGGDWTYSIIVPRSDPFSKTNAAESYQILHALLGGLLGEALAGEGITLTPEATEKVSRACFENPAQHDILLSGQKVAGAAQRRSRFGLLHQGSLQGVIIPPQFAERLAATLGECVAPESLRAQEMDEGLRLADCKYGTQEWHRRY